MKITENVKICKRIKPHDSPFSAEMLKIKRKSRFGTDIAYRKSGALFIFPLVRRIYKERGKQK